MNFRIKKVEKSAVGSVDFDNLPFGKICTDHMFVMEYDKGKWSNGEIRPLESFKTHPANLAWHYGQSIFEGMKAFKHLDGSPVLFRVDQHAKRLNASAKRMCMPEIPEEVFIDAVKAMVQLEKEWIPPKEGSALYIRPLMIATEEFIGVRPSDQYRFVIFTCPVGPYYSHPVSLRVEDKYVRATPGGVGAAKTAGNYAASLFPAQRAQEHGYDQVMWMDPFEFKYIHEVGTMNIFFIMDGKAYTPPLDGCILNGVTRDSIIKLLTYQGYEVIEAPLSIDQVYEAYQHGKLQEVFGTGTAAVISRVHTIGWGSKKMKLDPENFKIAIKLKKTINDIRVGLTPDPFRWITKLK